jgi:hypothetical protein
MSTTFQSLIQQAAKKLYGTIRPVVCLTTADGGAAGATLVDARLIDNRTSADATKYVDAWIRIPVQTTPYWEQECIRQIGVYAPATGTLTPIDPFGFAYDGGVSPQVTTAATYLQDTRRSWTVDGHIGNVVTCGGKTLTVTSNTATKLTGAAWVAAGAPGDNLPYSITRKALAGTLYEIHYELRPDYLKESLNHALRVLRRRSYTLLTEVTDGDMETSGVTNWTVGPAPGNCGTTKTVTAATVLNGTQALGVLNTVANAYVQSVAIPVAEGQTWFAAAPFRCWVGTAKLVAYDVTNLAEIKSWSAAVGQWAELGGDTFTIPTGCKSMTIRLQGVGAVDSIYWDSVCVFDVARVLLALPTWVTEENHVRGLWYQPQGQAGPGDSHFINYQWREHAFDWVPLVDEAAINPWRIEVSPSQRPLWLEGDRPWAELTLDTDTTNAPPDAVVARAVAYAYELLGRGETEYWTKKALEMEKGVEQRPQVVQHSPYTRRRAT